MRLQSVELYLYKPFLHHYTRHVTINDLSHVTVISGENACGKSSLLRAISPYPAISTDFEKGGFKKVIYTHNGSTYELWSDFRKSSGAHSFKKDGIELNESGTTDIQNGLVKEYLGYDDTIEKLLTGKYKICDMGKPERRTLFMSTYPSSMSFILDYFKSVSSRLRATNSNIKMLSLRQTSLEQKLISSNILKDYKKEKNDLERAIASIDLDLYTINKSIKSVEDILINTDPAIHNLTQAYFLSEIDSIYNRYTKLIKQAKDKNQFKDYKSIKIKLNTLKQELISSIDKIETHAKELREEIDKYKSHLSTNTESQIKNYEQQLEVQSNIIQTTDINPNIPILDTISFNKLKQSYQYLLESLDRLQNSTKPYWSEQDYHNAEIKINELFYECNLHESDIKQIQESISILEKRKENYSKYKWPLDCKRNCELRSTCTDAIESATIQQEEFKKKSDELEDKITDLQEKILFLQKDLKDRDADREILHKLNVYFSNVSWSDYALNNKDFITSINDNLTDIHNRVVFLLQNSENVQIVHDAKDMKQLLETKIETLKSSNTGAIEILKESVLKKEIQLNDLRESINTSRSKLIDIDHKTNILDQYDQLVQDIEQLNQKYNTWKNIYIIKAEMQYFREFANSITSCKINFNSRIRELDDIIQEQNNHSVILKDEIIPELKKLKSLQKDLAVVETQLSPTKGLSHRYIVRYINSVFSLANKFISLVWSYPMRLEYISEDDETFDYKFKLIINESSSISDINMASAGQKSIINLCLILAICIFRKYGSNYPLILDEVTINMSLNHQNTLIQFLNELLSQDDLMQVFIVDHCIDVCSSFASIAEMVCLSRDFDVGQEWKRIGVIE